MRKLATLAVAATAALALTAPVATAAPTTTATSATLSQADGLSAPQAAKLKLTKAKPGTHYGLAGNTITAHVKGKGKVTFSLDGAVLKKSKIKKGKAKVTLPSTLTPATYKVKAKYKKAKGAIKTIVWDSALNVSQAAFTISAATPSYDLPDLAGQVRFKGKVATTGYVDMYLNGNVKGGSSSPDYCCMASVGPDGTFEFGGYSFLGDAQERGVGTYQYKAFYTDGPEFADYIYSQWITVTVTP